MKIIKRRIVIDNNETVKILRRKRQKNIYILPVAENLGLREHWRI